MPQYPDQQNKDPGERDWLDRIGHWIIKGLTARNMILGSGVAFLLGVLLIVISYMPNFPSGMLTDLTRSMGKGLVVAVVVTTLISFLVTRYPEKLETALKEVIEQRGLAEQTKFHEDIRCRLEKLTAISKSIKESITIPDSMKVLNNEGISRVYGKRSEAVNDMIQDLQDQVTEIRIMGISLGDLITKPNEELHRVWGEIEKYVKSGVGQAGSGLNIRMLFIDPKCLGAQLRSLWESEETRAQSSLSVDVRRTATMLRNFKTALPVTHVSFEARLYHLPPQLFLLSTNKVSYVEPYYFWKRQPPKDMPLFRLADRESQLRDGVNDHFDLIWEKASTSLEQFYAEDQVGPKLRLGPQLQLGLDKGMYESGAINVYDDTVVTRKRMLQILKNAKERVYIQGISLDLTLGGENQPDDLIPTITNLVNHGIEVKILLLDPESEQAKFRAFREWYLDEPQSQMTFEQYGQDLHRQTKLYSDTKRTIQRLTRVQQNVRSDTLGVKKYNAAPCCFMFLVDNSVLVGQYVYGTVTRDKSDGEGSSILGKEMPLVEYVSQPRDVYDARQDKCVFEMMKDHFNFVFNHYACPIVTAPDNVKQPSSASSA